jgi:hypothetical protein
MKFHRTVINPEILQIIKDVIKEDEEGLKLPTSHLILKIQARCREKNLEWPTAHTIQKYFHKGK